MATTEWKSDFIESYVNVGIEQGLAQGAINAKSDDVIKALEVRGLQPTVEQCGQVTACTDLAQLDRWFERALTATSAAEVFTD